MTAARKQDQTVAHLETALEAVEGAREQYKKDRDLGRAQRAQIAGDIIQDLLHEAQRTRRTGG